MRPSCLPPPVAKTPEFGRDRKEDATNHCWAMAGNVTLWQFLLELLRAQNLEHIIAWTTNEENGEFKLIDAEEVARLWGMKKNKTNMNYDKLSRALRYYYDKGIIRKVMGQKFVYRFEGSTKGDQFGACGEDGGMYGGMHGQPTIPTSFPNRNFVGSPASENSNDSTRHCAQSGGNYWDSARSEVSSESGSLCDYDVGRRVRNPVVALSTTAVSHPSAATTTTTHCGGVGPPPPLRPLIQPPPSTSAASSVVGNGETHLHHHNHHHHRQGSNSVPSLSAFAGASATADWSSVAYRHHQQQLQMLSSQFRRDGGAAPAPFAVDQRFQQQQMEERRRRDVEEEKRLLLRQREELQQVQQRPNPQHFVNHHLHHQDQNRQPSPGRREEESYRNQVQQRLAHQQQQQQQHNQRQNQNNDMAAVSQRRRVEGNIFNFDFVDKLKSSPAAAVSARGVPFGEKGSTSDSVSNNNNNVFDRGYMSEDSEDVKPTDLSLPRGNREEPKSVSQPVSPTAAAAAEDKGPLSAKLTPGIVSFSIEAIMSPSPTGFGSSLRRFDPLPDCNGGVGGGQDDELRTPRVFLPDPPSSSVPRVSGAAAAGGSGGVADGAAAVTVMPPPPPSRKKRRTVSNSSSSSSSGVGSSGSAAKEEDDEEHDEDHEAAAPPPPPPIVVVEPPNDGLTAEDSKEEMEEDDDDDEEEERGRNGDEGKPCSPEGELRPSSSASAETRQVGRTQTGSSGTKRRSSPSFLEPPPSSSSSGGKRPTMTATRGSKVKPSPLSIDSIMAPSVLNTPGPVMSPHLFSPGPHFPLSPLAFAGMFGSLHSPLSAATSRSSSSCGGAASPPPGPATTTTSSSSPSASSFSMAVAAAAAAAAAAVTASMASSSSSSHCFAAPAPPVSVAAAASSHGGHLHHNSHHHHQLHHGHHPHHGLPPSPFNPQSSLSFWSSLSPLAVSPRFAYPHHFQFPMPAAAAGLSMTTSKAATAVGGGGGGGGDLGDKKS